MILYLLINYDINIQLLINKITNLVKNIMAGSLNKVQLIGRLGADPDIKQMVNGKNVARLSIATSQSWKDKSSGERKEKTEWHRVVIFNEGLVNVVQQYVKKGAQVYIEGELTTRKWKDEKSGTDKYSTEIVLQGFNSSFKILSSKNNMVQEMSSNKPEKSSLPSDDDVPVNDLDDEIPF